MGSQNVLGLILAALIAAGGVAVSLYVVSNRASDEVVAKGPTTKAWNDMIERVEAAELEVKRLKAEAASRDRGAPLEEPGEAGLSKEDVEAMIAAAFARKSENMAAMGGRKDPGEDEAFDFENVLAKLADPNLTDEEAMRLWGAIGKAGKFDEVIAYFENRAKEQAESAEAQAELGEAYLSKLRAGNISQAEMGTLGFKADAAFDRALALDDQHWDARFNKAVSLSFWPPVLGKQGEAIKHFEVLLKQQEGRNPRPEHAATHLFLGNIYQQRGEADKARAAWRRGAELFPDSAELQQRLQSAGN